VLSSTLSKAWNTPATAFKEAQILFTGALVVEVLYDKTCDYLHKLDFSDKTTSAHITFSSRVYLYWFCCCMFDSPSVMSLAYCFLRMVNDEARSQLNAQDCYLQQLIDIVL
jgi:hypothetical protein